MASHARQRRHEVRNTPSDFIFFIRRVRHYLESPNTTPPHDFLEPMDLFTGIVVIHPDLLLPRKRARIGGIGVRRGRVIHRKILS